MKSKRILLFVLIFMLAFMLVACNQDEKQDSPACFVIEDDKVYDSITQLEGEVIGYNEANSVVAIEFDVVKTNNDIDRTITVYSLKDNKVLGKYECSISTDRVDYSCDLSQYPLVKITKTTTTVSEDEWGYPEYDYDYDYYHYLASNSGEFVYLNVSSDTDNAKTDKVNNMYLCELGDKFYWVNKNLQVVRTDNLNVSDSYFGSLYKDRYFNFCAEYNNYLYAYETTQLSQMIVVYDPNGVASAKYNFTQGMAIVEGGGESLVSPKVHVLNNGNVLIQECIIIEDEADEFDFTYNGINLKLQTKIMNHKDGSVEEIAFKQLIVDFESAYERDEESSFPFKLAEDYDNQAYVVKVESGRIADNLEYVVFDNSLERKFTFKNDYLASLGSYELLQNANDDGYFAPALVLGNYVGCEFNWDGEIVKTFPSNALGFSDEFYVTESGIYTFDGAVVVDFEDSIFKGHDIDIELIGNRIYIQYENDLTGIDEVYTVNPETQALEIFIDSNEIEFIGSGKGYFTLYDEDKETSSVYNDNGEVILIVRGEIQLVELDDAVYVTATVDGEPLVYVLSQNTAAEEDKK